MVRGAKSSQWQAGAVIRKRLGDGLTYYARLLDFPWAAFYKYRTSEPSDDLESIVDNEVLFTLAAHKDLLAKKEWERVGHLPLEASLRPPKAQAIWRPDGSCDVITTADGSMRRGTPKECRGLEPAAVWEPEHIADRLDDAFAGREDRWKRTMLPD